MGNNFMAEARSGHADKVRAYLDKGCDIETRNTGGFTALIVAAEFDRIDVVKLLLGRGANMDAVNNDGLSSLMIAAHNGHARIVKILIDRGADLSIVDLHGRTVSSICRNGHARKMINAALDSTKSTFSSEYATVNTPSSPVSAPPSTIGSSYPSQGFSPEYHEIAEFLTGTEPEVVKLELSNNEEVMIGDWVAGGEHGSVFLGTWKEVNVCLKVLPLWTVFSEVERELATLMELRHPRIRSVLGVCKDLVYKGDTSLLLESVGPGSLHTILSGTTSSPHAPKNNVQRLRLGLDIADALHFLNHNQIVFKLLTSKNVFLDSEGRAKLGDAKYSQCDSFINENDDCSLWLAPEVLAQYRASDSEAIYHCTADADVFSLGIILLELLTGFVHSRPLPDLPDTPYNNIAEDCLKSHGNRPSIGDICYRLSCLLSETAAAEIIANIDIPALPVIPNSFICCIGYEVMVDPVMCADGHSYERAQIEAWLLNNSTSPKTNLILPHKNLIPNLALKEAIREAKLST